MAPSAVRDPACFGTTDPFRTRFALQSAPAVSALYLLFVLSAPSWSLSAVRSLTSAPSLPTLEHSQCRTSGPSSRTIAPPSTAGLPAEKTCG